MSDIVSKDEIQKLAKLIKKNVIDNQQNNSITETIWPLFYTKDYGYPENYLTNKNMENINTFMSLQDPDFQLNLMNQDEISKLIKDIRPSCTFYDISLEKEYLFEIKQSHLAVGLSKTAPAQSIQNIPNVWVPQKQINLGDIALHFLAPFYKGVLIGIDFSDIKSVTKGYGILVELDMNLATKSIVCHDIESLALADNIFWVVSAEAKLNLYDVDMLDQYIKHHAPNADHVCTATVDEYQLQSKIYIIAYKKEPWLNEH